jgi:hypothetical protein
MCCNYPGGETNKTSTATIFDIDKKKNIKQSKKLYVNARNIETK